MNEMLRAKKPLNGNEERKRRKGSKERREGGILEEDCENTQRSADA